MPDLYDYANLLEKGYEVTAKVHMKEGLQPPDISSWVSGFIACFGIVTGKVNVGLEGAPMDKVFDAIHEEIVVFHQKVAGRLATENAVRDTINGFKH